MCLSQAVPELVDQSTVKLPGGRTDDSQENLYVLLKSSFRCKQMIKKLCRVLSKELGEALKQSHDLNCRCSCAQRRAGCRPRVMDGMN